jgi:hypothetical protein
LLTDGEENACKYAAIMVANDKKSKNYEYSINGLGGPIVKSFNWIQEFNIKKKPANINRFIYMRTMKSEFINDVFKKEWIERIIDVDKALKESYLNIIGDMDRENTFNTLQLDNIDFRQRERRWGGRTISSSNRIINVISPLYFKRCIEAGMVIPPRFKKNKKLLRNVITRLHPQIAKEKMLNGAPCELISAKNFYKFSPMLTSLIKKSIRIGFKKLFKKNVFISNSIEYPRYKWYGKLFSNRKNFFINDFENWASAPLYVQSNLKEFVENAKGPGFKYYTQLEKMITLELRIRGDRVKNLV